MRSAHPTSKKQSASPAPIERDPGPARQVVAGILGRLMAAAWLRQAGPKKQRPRSLRPGQDRAPQGLE